MAIEMLKGPDASQRGSAGKFDLPPSFDQKRWAAHWVADRDVESMRGRQTLIGIPATADGLEVWKDPKTGKVHKLEVREGKFTLMCREREVESAVNILYGNLGKTMALAEQTGSTVAGGQQQDAGMLPESRLRGLGLVGEELERSEAQFKPTPIPHIGMPKGGHVDATRET